MAVETGVPMMEVTTAKVCPVNCAPVCPQVAFRLVYGQASFQLSLENFKKAISTIPSSVTISFSGFCEPFVNPHAIDMMEYAAQKGHTLRLFTTLLGASRETVDRVAAINPNVVCIHTPDDQGVAHLPDTPKFNDVLVYGMRKLPVTSFSRMSDAIQFVSNERAGNCDNAPQRRVHGPFHCDKLDHPEFVMLPDCDLVLCCMDWRMKHQIGNLLRQTWAEVIESPEYRRVIANSWWFGGDTLCRGCLFAVSAANFIPTKNNLNMMAKLVWRKAGGHW